MGAARVAVLISGSGSNLEALIRATRSGAAAGEIVLVISNRADAFGLERARRHGIATAVIPHRDHPSRAAFEAALHAALVDAAIDIVCLAGFMRILEPGFVEQWHDRMLNIHPSLLPALPGLRTHARALAAGALVHGCTVHLVRPTLDVGPILVQGVVPVLPGDDAATLAARVVGLEHTCYPLALDLVAGGTAVVDGEIVTAPPGHRRLVLHELFETNGQAAGPIRSTAPDRPCPTPS
ncbi:MAG: phosphoribosylglycinamide formyltransferase [Geminicoccaceae bacterium]